VSHHVQNERNRVRAAVAAILGTAIVTAWTPQVRAADANASEEKDKNVVLQEVQVTGSRIVRKDMRSNSPLVTVDQQKIEDSPFISVEEALNDLPQFMAGGAGMTSAIMNPMHLEIVKACMAADVMMGHDPDCARWIRRFREAPPMAAGGGAAAAAEGAARGRREGGHRRRPTTPT